MSKVRRDKRKIENLNSKLIDLLGDLYEYLSKQEKPTDEEARAYFIKCDKKWRSICKKNDLSTESYEAFKYEVSKVWAKKSEEVSEEEVSEAEVIE